MACYRCCHANTSALLVQEHQRWRSRWFGSCKIFLHFDIPIIYIMYLAQTNVHSPCTPILSLHSYTGRPSKYHIFPFHILSYTWIYTTEAAADLNGLLSTADEYHLPAASGCMEGLRHTKFPSSCQLLPSSLTWNQQWSCCWAVAPLCFLLVP